MPEATTLMGGTCHPTGSAGSGDGTCHHSNGWYLAIPRALQAQGMVPATTGWVVPRHAYAAGMVPATTAMGGTSPCLRSRDGTLGPYGRRHVVR